MVGERYGKVCRLKPSVQKRAVIADGAQENGGETPSAFARGKFEVRSQYTYKLASYWRLLLGLSGENRPDALSISRTSSAITTRSCRSGPRFGRESDAGARPTR